METKTFFTADTHYGHSAIIKYTNRPYQDVNQMNEALIQNWNNVVGEKDEVWVLGDFAFYSDVDKMKSIFNRLKGNKHLILGNHDRLNKMKELGWGSIHTRYELRHRSGTIVLDHFCLRTWNKAHYGTWHLHGHSHGTLQHTENELAIDVGVDCFNYTPVEYEEIKKIMSTRKFTPVDHHGAREL